MQVVGRGGLGRSLLKGFDNSPEVEVGSLPGRKVRTWGGPSLDSIFRRVHRLSTPVLPPFPPTPEPKQVGVDRKSLQEEI